MLKDFDLDYQNSLITLDNNSDNSVNSDNSDNLLGTTDYFLTDLAKKLKFKNFRGVFMRDELSRINQPYKQESGIMNFDTSVNPGSHWVAWYKINDKQLYYFDSYGTAVPDELRNYLSGINNIKKPKILHSDFMIQGLTTDICGELCCAFIYLMDYSGLSYKDVIRHLNERDDRR